MHYKALKCVSYSACNRGVLFLGRPADHGRQGSRQILQCIDSCPCCIQTLKITLQNSPAVLECTPRASRHGHRRRPRCSASLCSPSFGRRECFGGMLVLLCQSKTAVAAKGRKPRRRRVAAAPRFAWPRAATKRAGAPMSMFSTQLSKSAPLATVDCEARRP